MCLHWFEIPYMFQLNDLKCRNWQYSKHCRESYPAKLIRSVKILLSVFLQSTTQHSSEYQISLYLQRHLTPIFYVFRGDVQGSQVDTGSVQQAPGGPVRDRSVPPEPPGDTGRHLRHEHVRPVGVHVQGGGARVAGRALQLPEGSRVSPGEKRSESKYVLW